MYPGQMRTKKTLRQKGNDYQIWIRDFLLDHGWTVRNFPVISRPRYIEDKKTGKKKLVFLPFSLDVFGADLIARKGVQLLWIQASLDDHVTRRAEEYSKHFNLLMINEVLMIWMKGPKGTRIKRVRIYKKNIMVSDFGRIERGKFYPGPGVGELFFGDKIKKEKKDSGTKAE